MKTIAIANQKGGVGKTTTAVTLGHGLALRGQRVLLVDLDPQGHVAFALGMKKAPGLHRLLCNRTPLDDVAVQARENLDMIPSDKSTENAKRFVNSLNFREKVLLNALKGAVHYDFVLLDLAPSLDVLHVAALIASNWVLIPTRLDAMALDGVNEILRSVAEIAQQGYVMDGYSIVPTFFDRTTNETMAQLQLLVECFGARVWPPVPRSTKIREAAAYGQTPWEYCPQSAAVIGYQNGEERLGGYADVLFRLREVAHVR